jgi:hypothetical protein
MVYYGALFANCCDVLLSTHFGPFSTQEKKTKTEAAQEEFVTAAT